MKTLRLLLPLWAGLASAAVPVHCEMPATGILPSHINVEFVSRMGERHGGSDLSWSHYSVTLPFLDPRKSSIGSWALDAHVDLNATVLSTGGELDLRRNELYTAALPLSFIHVEKNQNRLILSMAPAVGSDFAGTRHYFDFNAAVLYTDQTRESFHFTWGVLVSPRFVNYGILPVFGFDWHLSPNWQIVLSRYKLSALYRGSERFQIGPFVSARGGAWMVDTPVGDRIFRVNTLVAGLTAEYDFHQGAERKRIIYASVGSTLATSAGYYNRKYKKDTIEAKHYKPGVYVSAGVDFRF